LLYFVVHFCVCSVLETLDLSCNYFSNEADVEPSTRIPRLTALKLYGNPLLGPTCEDPLYVYIEGLVDDALAHRDAHAPHLPHIDFFTEFPRVRNLKKGQPLGRQAAYRDFAIVQVDTAGVLTQRAWREKGNRSIFAETMQKKRKGELGGLGGTSMSAASLPDHTFITGSDFLGGGAGGGHHGHGHGHSHGHNNSHQQQQRSLHDIVADDVMQRVAGEMGLVNSAELLLLRDGAAVRSSYVTLLLLSLVVVATCSFCYRRCIRWCVLGVAFVVACLL
jgi:hypothetical protein